MAEGLHGQSREALVPAICEYLNIPYTGSDPLTLALSLHKGRTKETLAYRGVPTAPFTCIEAPGEIERMALTYPVFVKPVAEGSGKGVFASNLCANVAALRERARFLLERYAEPVLVETYLPGPEFTVAILGNGTEAYCPPVRRRCTATRRSGCGTDLKRRSRSSSARHACRRRCTARSSAPRSTPTTRSDAATGVGSTFGWTGSACRTSSS